MNEHCFLRCSLSFWIGFAVTALDGTALAREPFDYFHNNWNVIYPEMRRAVDWTMKSRRQAPADSPFVGVSPNALADGEYLWNGEYHIVGYDL